VRATDARERGEVKRPAEERKSVAGGGQEEEEEDEGGREGGRREKACELLGIIYQYPSNPRIRMRRFGREGARSRGV